MSVYVLPAAIPGDTVESYGRRVIGSATAHVEQFDMWTIAHESDVDTDSYRGHVGPAREWVKDVVESACLRIREADVWDNMGTYDADDVLINDGSDAPDVASDLADTVQDADTYTDGWSETAEEWIPAGTHDLMATFVDTASYYEVPDWVDKSTPMTIAADCLRYAAERICQATATEVAAVIRSAIQEG